MIRCNGCGRPRFLSPLGSFCRRSDPADPDLHDFTPSPQEAGRGSGSATAAPGRSPTLDGGTR